MFRYHRRRGALAQPYRYLGGTAEQLERNSHSRLSTGIQSQSIVFKQKLLEKTQPTLKLMLLSMGTAMLMTGCQDTSPGEKYEKKDAGSAFSVKDKSSIIHPSIIYCQSGDRCHPGTSTDSPGYIADQKYKRIARECGVDIYLLEIHFSNDKPFLLLPSSPEERLGSGTLNCVLTKSSEMNIKVAFRKKES